MATVAEKLLTAREVALLPDPPDGASQELVREEVIIMQPPMGLHGVGCAATTSLVDGHVRPKKLERVFSNDIGFLTETDPDTVCGANIAFWSFARLPVVPVNEYIGVAPDLAVETLSPGNEAADIREKVFEYLHPGVRMIWVNHPARRSVTVYRSPDEGKLLHEKATLSGEEVLPGFPCQVANLFA